MILIYLSNQQQQQHPPPFAPDINEFIVGGLWSEGLPFPFSDNSSSNKKHWKIVSEANEKILIKMPPITYPIMPATMQGKYGDEIASLGLGQYVTIT